MVSRQLVWHTVLLVLGSLGYVVAGGGADQGWGSQGKKKPPKAQWPREAGATGVVARGLWVKGD